jgi:tetratricopeptide (TPR) repeat protein
MQDANRREAYATAANYLKKAIALDANLAQAYHHLSLVRYVEWMAFWSKNRAATFQESLTTARQAVALDLGNSGAEAHLALLLSYTGDYDQAAFHFARALQFNPNDSRALAVYGFFLTATGRTDEALTAFNQSFQLNPMQPGWTNWLKGIAHFTARRHRDAVLILSSIARPMNEVRGWLAAAYGHTGELEKARVCLASFLEHANQEMPAAPGDTITAWKPFWQGAIPYKDPQQFEHIYEGLRLAGMKD